MPVFDSLTLSGFADLMSQPEHVMTDTNLFLNPTITAVEAIPSLFSLSAITGPRYPYGFFLTNAGTSKKHKP